MPPELYPYQLQGADFLANRSRAYLADEPGLGKSAQAIRACDLVQAQRVLVLCPASLKSNWAREFRKFGRTRRDIRTPKTTTRLAPLPGVTIINWDIIARPEILRQVLRQQWDVVIGDEAHVLKSLDSQRGRAVLGIDTPAVHTVARHMWLLSGTPAPNHPGEFYPVLQAFDPALTLDLSYRAWLKHYCYVQDTVYGPRVLSTRANIHELRRSLHTFLLKRKVEEVLTDMPDLTTDVWLLDGEAARRSVERHCADHEDLDALLSLADTDYLDEAALEELESSELATVRRLCGSAKAPILAERIADELDHGLDAIVLMCWHHDTMDLLQKLLQKYGVARVDGTTRNADAEVQKFQLPKNPTDCRVFIGQIQSAGVGHTMTRAHQMVIVEPSWVPGENDQAMRRIRRIGQKRGCLVRYAALGGTIDEAVMASAERKARILAQTY